MKLNSNLREVDERIIIDQDQRIKAFRKKQWDRNEGFEPLEMALLTIIASACIALGLICIGIIIWIKYFGS